MLRATYRALKPGGRICYYVIATKEDLSSTDRARIAKREGNEYVESATPYRRLMAQAGFVDIEVTDVSGEYLATMAAWKREWEAEADSLIELLGGEEFSRRIHNRVLDLANAEAGLLKRFQVFGVKR